MIKGKVYLVGAGPAGKDLITVRGLKILRLADVVIYDYLVAKDLLDEARSNAELICCDTLGKKSKGVHRSSQEKINKLLVAHAKKGKMVVRLKNGDPFIFGRAGEELGVLRKAGVSFEVIPGVTAAQAGAAFSGIPLTDRSSASSVTFATGHEALDKDSAGVDWKSFAGKGTIVLYMAVARIRVIARKLVKAGRNPETPVAVVARAGRVDQKTLVADLRSIADLVTKARITAPAIFIIGDVVTNSKKFDWLSKNRRVLDTGLYPQQSLNKATVFHLPLCRILPLDDYTAFDHHILDVKQFNWIIFTSRFGVMCFFERLTATGKDARALSGVKVAVIGLSTAEKLQGFGVKADVVAGKESAKGLLNTLRKERWQGQRVFYPHSDLSDKLLAMGLNKLGADVTTATAYRNAPRKDLPDLDIDLFDEIYFTSPSGVRNFIKRYGHPARRIKIRCIGPVTSAEARKSGIL